MLSLKQKLVEITSDKTSGSLVLLEKLIGQFEVFFSQNIHRQMRNELPDLLELVSNKLLLFPVVTHFLTALSVVIKENNDVGPCLDFIERYKTIWSRVKDSISEEAYNIISPTAKTILTHSNSGQVRHFFSFLKKKACNVQIVQTISHPEMEGRLQADYIASLGFDVKLIEDAETGSIFNYIDVVVCGVDAVTGIHFLNKTGTRTIGLLCSSYKKPFYVLCDPRKIIPDSSVQNFCSAVEGSGKLFKPDFQHPSGGNTNMDERYFEWIEKTLVTKFITVL